MAALVHLVEALREGLMLVRQQTPKLAAAQAGPVLHPQAKALLLTNLPLAVWPAHQVPAPRAMGLEWMARATGVLQGMAKIPPARA